MKSIGTKLALQIAVAIIIVMTIFGVLDISQRRKQFAAFLDSKETIYLQQLSLILSEMLFYMNLEPIEHILDSYLIDTEILAIKVIEEEEIVEYAGKDPATQEIIHFSHEEVQPPEYANAVTRQVPIIFEERDLGRLEIVFSRNFIHAEVQKTITTLSTSLLLVIVIESLVVLSLSRKKITRPLLSFVQVARQIAEGDITIQLPKVHSKDEIGILTLAFKRMILYLRHMADVATEISKGDLRHQLHPKSERDVLGQAFLDMSAYLNNMAATATAIAEGDLRQNCEPKTEHDVLGNAFQKMRFLRQSISEIMNGTLLLREASKDLNQISLQMASSAEQTSRQVMMISTTCQQISQDVEAVATSSEESSITLNDLSQNTFNIAQITNTAVEKARSANTVIRDLETRSQEIGNVISIITDVTQQTNLLALNATIEAARAGEYGKGFTVVANEIKELSRETAASTANIIQNLEAIRTISHAVAAANHEVTEIIVRIREFADSIVTGLEAQNVTTRDIVHRMTDAAQGNKHISLAISDVAASAEETSEGAAELQHSAQELALLADQLQQLVDRFKI